VSALSSEALGDHYRQADMFVFPWFFEGFGLVLLEAMACSLPAIASTATAGADVLTEASGRLLPVGDLDSLVDALRWFDQNRSGLPAMGQAARKTAEKCTWDRYRRAVTEAPSPFI
jgi:glycosyltransferase involved in cell wall biosynthesis